MCSRACAIELEDTVVVTGGSGPSATVQVYNISGAQGQLPDLRTARSGHACAHFLDSQNRVVSITVNIILSCTSAQPCACVYRVAGLSCPEAGVCLSAILRGFPDSRAANDPLVLSQSLYYSRRFYIPNTMLNRHQPTVCSMYKT